MTANAVRVDQHYGTVVGLHDLTCPVEAWFSGFSGQCPGRNHHQLLTVCPTNVWQLGMS